jgi:hypothetical protein
VRQNNASEQEKVLKKGQFYSGTDSEKAQSRHNIKQSILVIKLYQQSYQKGVLLQK